MDRASIVSSCWVSAVAICLQASRISYGTSVTALLWQAMRPHSLPSRTMDTDIEAATPMFFKYWMWTGDTLRRAQSLISTAPAPERSSNGAGA